MNAYPARASFTTFPETFTNLTGRRGVAGIWLLIKQLVTEGERREIRKSSLSWHVSEPFHHPEPAFTAWEGRAVSKDCLLSEYPRCYVKHLLQVGLEEWLPKAFIWKGKNSSWRRMNFRCLTHLLVPVFKTVCFSKVCCSRAQLWRGGSGANATTGWASTSLINFPLIQPLKERTLLGIFLGYTYCILWSH